MNQAIQLFLHSHFEQSDRSGKTFKAYECDLRQFAAFLGGDPPLVSVRPEDCEAWIAGLKQKGAAAATRKRKVATLRSFFNESVRRRRLPASPLSGLRFRFPTGNVIPRALLLAEACALLKTARRLAASAKMGQIAGIGRAFLALRNLSIVEILISTGIRVGELTSLATPDVVADERFLRIQGKGGKQRLALLVDDRCYETAKRYLDVRNRLTADHDGLFLNTRGGRLSEQGVAYVLRALAEKAELERPLTPHMLRHTAATMLLQNGADIRIVQEFLGHASIATTQRYAHVTRHHLRSVLRSCHFGNLLNG